MNEFIVTVKSHPKGLFDKGIDKFRVYAHNETGAENEAKKHSLYPTDGKIIKVIGAAYKRKSKPLIK